jgi:hypothetical protein
MSTRRYFLTLAVKGSAMTAAAALLPTSASAQGNTGDSRGMNSMENDANSGSNVHYKPPFTFGLGGVPLGNEFAVVTDKDAHAILEAAWSAGIRYYDASPWYGLGRVQFYWGALHVARLVVCHGCVPNDVPPVPRLVCALNLPVKVASSALLSFTESLLQEEFHALDTRRT